MTWQNFAVIGNSSIFGDLQEEEITKKKQLQEIRTQSFKSVKGNQENMQVSR